MILLRLLPPNPQLHLNSPLQHLLLRFRSPNPSLQRYHPLQRLFILIRRSFQPHILIDLQLQKISRGPARHLHDVLPRHSVRHGSLLDERLFSGWVAPGREDGDVGVAELVEEEAEEVG